MSEHVWWYLARSSGIVAWALLAGSVLLGLVLSTRALGRRPAPAWTADLHRGVGGMAVVLTGLHLSGLVADSTVRFGALELLVPFTGTWRPVAVAWGVLALYVLVAVEVSSLWRRRLSTRAWRAVHLASYPLYVLATAHLLTAGSDAGSPWLLAVVWLSMVAIASLTLVRLLVPRGRGRTRPAPARAEVRTVSRASVEAGRTAAPVGANGSRGVEGGRGGWPGR
jgi:DMSO/TMAO reductase YedYZ heme-binding membrane subunit